MGWLTTASLTAYVGCFAIGLGPVFWLLISEIFPLAVRARGISAATIANWLANLVVALTFLDLVDLLGRPGNLLALCRAHVRCRRLRFQAGAGTKGLSLEAVEAFWVARAKDQVPQRAAAANVRE